MIVLGIVGSPAGGKSTVAALLEDRGGTWINADQIARQVLELPEIQAELIAHFGLKITDKAGRVDRGKLAGIVFGADGGRRAELNYLEGLIHPPTRRLITDELKQVQRAESASRECQVAILDVPLLFESAWDRSCDQIWCIDSPFPLRLQRARNRGWNEDELRRREANQLSIARKRQASDIVIDNDGDLQQLNDTIDRLWSSLRTGSSGVADDDHCRFDD